MNAAGAGKPAIMLTAGPRGLGQFQGRSIVTPDAHPGQMAEPRLPDAPRAESRF
jgi:hypothetical protein